MFRRVVVVLAAMVTIGAVVHVLAPPGAPPLYDGIGFPDEPYRYVAPPAGYRHTKPPTEARSVFPAVPAGPKSDQFVSSNETGPQVSLFLSAGSLTAPQGDATVTAVPIPAPAVSLTGYGWGNVYRIGFGSAVLTPGALAQIQMRAPTPQQPGPTFEVLRGNTWQRLSTKRTGNDIYATRLTAPGDYRLVGSKPLDVNASDPNNEANISVVGTVGSIVGVVAVIVIFVVIERRRSRRRRERRDAAPG